MTGPGERALRAAVRRHAANDGESPERIALWTALAGRCSVEDLRSLCFMLGISYDAFAADTRAGKARELVAHFDRREDLDTVTRALQRIRPDIHL